jgi:DNA sulfur modification protein DndD
MYIEKVIINNFRIYYGTNSVEFAPSGARNISIICGDNGRGKTTFLTALVWCLYGKQMQEVDKFFRERILTAGGYNKYLVNSMNKLAKLEGQNDFCVSIHLKEVELPGIPSNPVRIRRTFNVDTESEFMELNIDDNNSELVQEVGRQVFIQDFIMPNEIAKFFFFDAERIVELAEIRSIPEKRSLSQAYSEVLGIKKYEELRNNLKNLRIRFRKDSASSEERIQFEHLGREINKLKKSVEYHEAKKERFINEKLQLRHKADKLQEQLLREGSLLTLAEIENLKQEKLRLNEKEKELMTEFKELLEYAPFAIMGEILAHIKNQLNAEEKIRKSVIARELIEDKIKKIMQELESGMSMTLGTGNEIKPYYIAKVSELLNKYFLIGDEDYKGREIKILHDFTSQEKNDFEALFSSLQTSYRGRLYTLAKLIRNIRLDHSNLNKRLTCAESEETNASIHNYRLEKGNTEKALQNIEDEVLLLSQTIGSLGNEIASKMALYDEIANKIRVNERYEDKDLLATRLINELDDFIKKFKETKKQSLEKRILANLNTLMHKRDFIRQVVVEIINEIIEIRFYDSRGYEIKKDDLSKGEQQLYATALLKALVEESRTDFPVFIDSPLQKFDDKHARNIITIFYPNIAKQVVLFPLPRKEFGEEEYRLLIDNVESTYVINNYREDASIIEKVDPSILFTKDKYKHRIAKYV